MKIIFVIILFLQSYVIANINIDKKAITVVLSSTLTQSKQIATYLNQYDLYIYKPSTTKTSYYVIYVVNIEKENQHSTLEYVKKLFGDAYISSDSRVKQLATYNFEKNIFIKAFTSYEEKAKQVAITIKPEEISTVKIVESKPEVVFEQIKEIKIVKKEKNISEFIDNDKKSLFIGFTKNKKELLKFLKRYKFHDIFIENINEKGSDYHHCCAIYIVNIKDDNFDFLVKYMKKYYPLTKAQATQELINTQYYSKYIARKNDSALYQPDGCN